MDRKEEKQNRAQEHEPRSGHHAPARGGPGQERKFSNRAFGDGRMEVTSSPHRGADLGHAVDELHSQHPIKHHDAGPHHGKSYHDRHETLGGLHPKSRHGR
jgi:hypothetical protein